MYTKCFEKQNGELFQQAMAIRMEVFVEEQNVDVQDESDIFDEVATHMLLFTDDGLPIGVARIIPDQNSSHCCSMGRFAVLKGYRKQYNGTALLDAVHKVCQQMGFRSILIHAQLSAVSFYIRSFYILEGPQFEEAGIMHNLMRFKF